MTPGTTGYDVMRQIKTLLAERPAYQYFRICLQGYKDPDVIFDLNKLSHLERIVDVTEQLRPDYDYDKLLELTLQPCRKKGRIRLQRKHWNTALAHCWGMRYADKGSRHFSVWKATEQKHIL